MTRTRWMFLTMVLMFALLVVPTRHASAAVAWPVIKAGNTGESVCTLQAMLRQAGYTAVSYNCSFDSATTTAVKQYQTANGLTSDGIVGTNTWESITSRSSSLVQQGSNNLVVNALQRQLKNNYGFNLTIDGAFGSGTKAKVVSFQKGVNLSADGVVGRNTWFQLISGDTARIRHSSALSQLNGAGISVTSSGVVTADRTTNPSTSLEQMRQNTVSGLISFKSASGCAVTVTGGTENYIHSGGTYSHWTGYKIDISYTTCVTNYIQGHFTYAGQRSDGAALYKDSAGNIYANESFAGHWDILYY